MSETATKQAWTIPEAAERLGISRNAAYAAANRGELPSIRIGKRILVPMTGLQQLLDGSWKPSTPEAETS